MMGKTRETWERTTKPITPPKEDKMDTVIFLLREIHKCVAIQAFGKDQTNKEYVTLVKERVYGTEEEISTRNSLSQ